MDITSIFLDDPDIEKEKKNNPENTYFVKSFSKERNLRWVDTVQAFGFKHAVSLVDPLLSSGLYEINLIKDGKSIEKVILFTKIVKEKTLCGIRKHS